MSAIVNTRDLLLQATSPRLVPIPIPISNIEGLDVALANAGRRVDITATSSTFAGVNNPTSITLTAELKGGLTGTVVWSVVTGALTLSPNGNTCVINNTSMTTASAVIRARVTVGGINYDGKYTLTKLGSLAAQDYVNLQTQVAGQLNSGNVTGLGALALLNTVNLNTQVTGALASTNVSGLGTLATLNSVNLNTQVTGKLDANTQVNNLGALAYVNGLAANQIGAGQLAAGVVYAGQIVATQISSGSFSGKTFTGGTFSGTDIQTNTGTIGGVRINTNGLNTGGYSGYAWPASGQNGFHLGPQGLLLGNGNDGKYFYVTSDGNIYAPGFSVVGGNATFSGTLSAASGSFSGSLTANAINAVSTINIAGAAVTTTNYNQFNSPAPPNVVRYAANTQTYITEVWVDMGQSIHSGSGVVVTAAARLTPDSDASVYIRIIRIRDGLTLGFAEGSVMGGWTGGLSVAGYDADPVAGGNGYKLIVESPSSGPGAGIAGIIKGGYIIATGGKR